MIMFNKPKERDPNALPHATPLQQPAKGSPGGIPQLKISNMFIKKPAKKGEQR